MLFLFFATDIGSIEEAYIVVAEDRSRLQLERIARFLNITPIEILHLNEIERACKQQTHGTAHLKRRNSYKKAKKNNPALSQAPSFEPKIDIATHTSCLHDSQKECVTKQCVTNTQAGECSRSASPQSAENSPLKSNINLNSDQTETITNHPNSSPGKKICVNSPFRSAVNETRAKTSCVDNKENKMEMTVLAKPHTNHQANGPSSVHAYDNTALGGFEPGDSMQGGYESMDSADEITDNSTDSRPQHREMAIDVPANFVGVKKEPPRLPPHFQGSQSGNSSQHSTPSKSSSHKRPPFKAPPPTVPPQIPTNPPKMTKEEELENMAKIQKYQEDLRKRKEIEESFQREQEFLRNSLRDSQKLRDLQENGPSTAKTTASPLKTDPAGFTNPNYMIEEEEATSGDNVSKSSTLPMRTQPDAHLYKQPLSK